LLTSLPFPLVSHSAFVLAQRCSPEVRSEPFETRTCNRSSKRDFAGAAKLGYSDAIALLLVRAGR